MYLRVTSFNTQANDLLKTRFLLIKIKKNKRKAGH